MNSEALEPSGQVYLLISYELSCSRDSQQHCCSNGSEFDFCRNIVLNLLALRLFYKEVKKFCENSRILVPVSS